MAGGVVEADIGRHPRDRKRMAVVSGAKPARTHYRVLEKFAAHSYLALRLDTGRTHQIRVHMAHIRHPLVGDSVYAPSFRPVRNCGAALQLALRNFPRQALHAKKLCLIHPCERVEMTWTSPLPSDFSDLLLALRADSDRLSSVGPERLTAAYGHLEKQRLLRECKETPHGEPQYT